MFLTTTLTIALCVPFVSTHDLQLTINETGISELLDFFTPFIDHTLSGLSTDAQSITGTVNTDIDNITIANVSHDPITFKLDPINQSIHVSIPNLDILINPTEFEAWQQVIERVSCFGITTPEIYDYNISFIMDVTPNELCTFNITLEQSSIIITDSKTEFNIELNSGVCELAFDITNFIFNIEQSLLEDVIDTMPPIIESKLEQITAELIDGSRFIETFNGTIVPLCFKNVEVGIDGVHFSVDLSLNETNNTMQYSTVYTRVLDANIPEDDLTFLNAMIAWTMLVFILGILIGFCLMYCVSHKDKKSWFNCCYWIYHGKDHAYTSANANTE